MRKLSIYLGDLVHNSMARGPFTMPLNIGYVAAYAKKDFDKDIDIRLFKYPKQMVDAIKEAPPDILGLGDYTWNTDLNYRIIEFAKSYSNDLIAILGGPNLPVNEDGQKDYLTKRSLVDFSVVDQGEPGFMNFLNRVLENAGNRAQMKDAPIDGCVFLSSEKKRLVVGKGVGGEFSLLNEVPSPYLSGILDEFFGSNVIPIIETDRGCPYTCAFCAWGKTTNCKVRPFDISRVKAELDYITEQVKKTDYTNFLYIADANFGIFERDKEIAEYMKQLNVNSGYPRKINAAWAKNTPNRIIDMAEILGDMVEVTMSFQSMDPVVLENIKRSNIKTSAFMELQKQFSKKGIPTTSELILGMPGETKESHLEALRVLLDAGAGNLINYNCMILGGTVLETREEREQHGIKTKYRLFDIQFGKYDGIIAIETNEVVRSTNTISEEDILFFRPLHWLIQFLWSYKYYIHLLKYLQSERIHPVDFMVRLISDRKNASAIVDLLFSNFEKDSKGEWFDTPEELFDYYSNKENFEKIMKEGFPKLNYKYMFDVLFSCRDEFDVHLTNTAKNMIDERLKGEAKETAHNIVDNLIRYMRFIYIDFDENLDFEKEKEATFEYDIAGWEKNGYTEALISYNRLGGVSYLFYSPDEHYKGLKTSIRNFRQEDRNATLRKMSEYMKKADLFYTVLN